MTIELNKQYKTRDGREVRIYAVDGGKPYPVHGSIKVNDDQWELASWQSDGRLSYKDYLNDSDLIEVRPRIKRKVWANVYPGGIVNVRYTRADADDDATSDRIACVRLTIDCEEGDGL